MEPICQHSVIQPNAFFACIDFNQNINIPPIGNHVNVTGSYVLDTWHDKWAEIHPVTKYTATAIIVLIIGRGDEQALDNGKRRFDKLKESEKTLWKTCT